MHGLDRGALLRQAQDGVDDAHGRRLTEAWLDGELGLLEDGDFAAGFARACPVPGVDASAYRPQWLPGSPGLLAGIRFKGGDVTLPFVELIAWDEPLRDAQVWRDVRRRVASHFEAFAPGALRVRWPGEHAPPADGDAELDQWLLSSPLAELRQRPREDLPAHLRLEPPDDLSWYPRLRSGFATWRSTAGGLGHEVEMATRDELEQCMRTGAVLCLWGDGVWGGVVAAQREDDRSVGGYCVVEEFLDAGFRGQGLARHLQRHLVDHLDDTGADALWGTIHATNAPSLATALAAGRRRHEGWWFLPLAGPAEEH